MYFNESDAFGFAILFHFLLYINFISACLNKKSDGMSGKAMSIFETFLPAMFGEG